MRLGWIELRELPRVRSRTRLVVRSDQPRLSARHHYERSTHAVRSRAAARRVRSARTVRPGSRSRRDARIRARTARGLEAAGPARPGGPRGGQLRRSPIWATRRWSTSAASARPARSIASPASRRTAGRARRRCRRRQGDRHGQGGRTSRGAGAGDRADDRVDRRAHQRAVGRLRRRGGLPRVPLLAAATRTSCSSTQRSSPRRRSASSSPASATGSRPGSRPTRRPRPAPPAMAGGAPLQAALTLARLCYDTLLEHGVAARQAVERNVVTPAVERVVEANTLLSGLGFESGGLAAAHSIHNGLTALHETHEFWHGEKVSFGVVAMLVLEGRPTPMLDELVDFCLEVGLPVTLGDVGVERRGRGPGPGRRGGVRGRRDDPQPPVPGRRRDGGRRHARRRRLRARAAGGARAHAPAPRRRRVARDARTAPSRAWMEPSGGGRGRRPAHAAARQSPRRRQRPSIPRVAAKRRREWTVSWS